MTKSCALAYVEQLNLSCNAWQAYETWTADGADWAVLSIFDSGLEGQWIIRAPIDGSAVRWIPCRFFASTGGRDGLRGECLWFNPKEVWGEDMAGHNRRVLERPAIDQPTPFPLVKNPRTGAPFTAPEINQVLQRITEAARTAAGDALEAAGLDRLDWLAHMAQAEKFASFCLFDSLGVHQACQEVA